MSAAAVDRLTPAKQWTSIGALPSHAAAKSMMSRTWPALGTTAPG